MKAKKTLEERQAEMRERWKLRVGKRGRLPSRDLDAENDPIFRKLHKHRREIKQWYKSIRATAFNNGEKLLPLSYFYQHFASHPSICDWCSEEYDLRNMCVALGVSRAMGGKYMDAKNWRMVCKICRKARGPYVPEEAFRNMDKKIFREKFADILKDSYDELIVEIGGSLL